MAISSGELEASAARKWLGAVIGDERERTEEEEEGVHILTFYFFFTDIFSVNKILMEN